MSELLKKILTHPKLRWAARNLSPERPVRLGGLWGSAAPLAAAAVARIARRPMLLLAGHLDEADELADDIEVLTARAAHLFPAWETDIGTDHINDEVAGERLNLCNLLAREAERGTGILPVRPTGVPPVTDSTQPAQQGQDAPATHGRDAHATLPIIVAPVMALLQPVPSPAELAQGRLTLRPGDTMAPDALAAWLVDAGFDHVEQVDQQGEFARRGGIMDVFPPGATLAVRIEFFGDQVDSLRPFDLDTQRSTDTLDRIDLAGYTTGRSLDQSACSLLDYLPADTIICVPDPQAVRELADQIHQRCQELGPQTLGGRRDERWQEELERSGLDEPKPRRRRKPSAFDDTLATEKRRKVRWEDEEVEDELDALGQAAAAGPSPLARLLEPPAVFERLDRFARLELFAFRPNVERARPLNEQPCTEMGVRSLERISLNTAEALTELSELAAVADAWVFCENPAEQKRFVEMIAVSHPQLAQRARLGIGHVRAGFYWPDERLVVVGHHELFHRYSKVRRIRRVRAGRPIESLLDLREGDYVVHVLHGVARFEGLRALQRDGRSEEFLTLRFADNAVLHVPAGSIDLVQKYIGSPRARPTLSKLGGATWARQKQRVEAAVLDMAGDMLKVQALRRAMPGHSYQVTAWQREFAQEFIYSETEDQLRAVGHIDQDMVEPRPMDRLLCGDVGFGKTELAMRAAFKVVEGGRQVGVLVPTTVLADQHYRTFRERFADYPFEIEMISRFRNSKQQSDILRRLLTGKIDVLIGTHRLLSKDVEWSELGLLIIDEEQRFGVEHKEKLRSARATLDVLTLTATPIPRTLHMALLGLRDISALSTPPLDRRAIHTEVCHYDDRLVRAVILRELNRQGQVFFVHNRVQDILPLAQRIRALVPEARIEVAHGQMPEGRLEKIMLRFVRQEIDVLLCTTIVESGLDIPTANTMIIHEADRFGLAQLHQLRGRVGRYKHRAYCYLLLPERRPVTPVAAKRLKAVEEFSDLGAGFQIAMRDLEIRGAGNILGREQSGHIATVGYELYCRMLEHAVRTLQGQPPPPRRDVHVELNLDAYIPGTYVPAERQRMEIYRRMVKCERGDDLRQLEHDLADAFGPVPPAVRTLLDACEIRLLAGRLGVDSIIRMDPDIIFSVRDFKLARAVLDLMPGTVRLPDARTAHWRPPAPYLETPTLLRVMIQKMRQALGEPPPPAPPTPEPQGPQARGPARRGGRPPEGPDAQAPPKRTGRNART